MAPKSCIKKTVSKKEQDAIITKHRRTTNIDLRKATFTSHLLLFFKKRPHYAREICNKLMGYSGSFKDSYETSKQLNAVFTPALKLQKNIIYGNLRRFEKLGVLGSYKEKSNQGAERKYYFLTDFGNRYFTEVVQKWIYPRICLFHCLWDMCMDEKFALSKEELQKYRKMVRDMFA